MALRYGYVHGCVRALLNHCDYVRVHHRRRRDCDQGSTDYLKLWTVSQNNLIISGYVMYRPWIPDYGRASRHLLEIKQVQ